MSDYPQTAVSHIVRTRHFYFAQRDTTPACFGSFVNILKFLLFGCLSLFAYLNAKLFQLLWIYRSRSLGHQAGCVLYLRECDDFTDAVAAAHEHYHTVKAVCQASVRRNSVLEGFKQETELLLCLFRSEAQYLKHLGLDVALVDTDGTTADLGTV